MLKPSQSFQDSDASFSNEILFGLTDILKQKLARLLPKSTNILVHYDFPTAGFDVSFYDSSPETRRNIEITRSTLKNTLNLETSQLETCGMGPHDVYYATHIFFTEDELYQLLKKLQMPENKIAALKNTVGPEIKRTNDALQLENSVDIRNFTGEEHPAARIYYTSEHEANLTLKEIPESFRAITGKDEKNRYYVSIPVRYLPEVKNDKETIKKYADLIQTLVQENKQAIYSRHDAINLENFYYHDKYDSLLRKAGALLKESSVVETDSQQQATQQPKIKSFEKGL